MHKSANPWHDLHVLIMAGGSGTRFWPKSRATKPKQLLPLWDEKSLLLHTVERFTRLVPPENIWVVTTEALVDASKKALGPGLEKVRFLGEPRGANTAPCILWGIEEIRKVATHGVVAVMPADHYIGDLDGFYAGLEAAVRKAWTSNALVTLGITPTGPETGYGYIEVDNSQPVFRPAQIQGTAKTAVTPAAGFRNIDVKGVKRFVEKPDLATARKYLESGNFVWNAGMFIFELHAGVEAFEKTMPELFRLFQNGQPVGKIYASIEKKDAVSVDYGVIERAAEKGIPLAVVPVSCGWNDVGSFTALEEIGRATVGESLSVDSSGNIVNSDGGLVALVGVENLIVVRSGDVVLVCAKDRAQDIKKMVDLVKERAPGRA